MALIWTLMSSFKKTLKLQPNVDTSNIAIAGDMNVVLDIHLDKSSSVHSQQSKSSHVVKNATWWIIGNCFPPQAKPFPFSLQYMGHTPVLIIYFWILNLLRL